MVDFQNSVIEYFSNNIHLTTYKDNDDIGARPTFTIGNLKSSMFFMHYDGQDISHMVNPLVVYFSIKERYNANILQTG